MLRKLVYLLIIFSSLLFSGCSGRTVDIQPVSSIEEGKSLFDEFDLPVVFVKFHQDKNGIAYDEVSTVPFTKKEIARIYKENGNSIKAGTENKGLSDCLRIYPSGLSKQCYNGGRNTLFLKKGVVNEVIDKKAMGEYGKYLVYLISADLEKSKSDFKSYKKYLQDSTLINLAHKNMIDQLRSFGSKEAYDLAYDMSLSQQDLEKAYPTIRDIEGFLVKPHKTDLLPGELSNCFRVKPSSLNIRNKPTTKGSKIVGKYSKGAAVCSAEEKNGWIRSIKGWTSKTYLIPVNKSNREDLAGKIAKVKKLKRIHDLQASLKANSATDYEAYLKTYGSGQGVDARLQALYRKEGENSKSADMFKKAYNVSANNNDAVNFIKYSSLESVRNEYLAPSFIKSKSHRDLLKASLIERLRKIDSLESSAEAFRYSGISSDLLKLDAVFEDGLREYDNKEYIKAIKLFQQVANLGYPKAQYKIGEMYSSGDGITEDRTEALKWYRKAAIQGDAKSQCALGDMLSDLGQKGEPDFKEAFKWYQKAANQGNAEAQTSIGFMYAVGHGVKKNRKESFKWYLKAANQGNLQGQIMTAYNFYEGDGTKRNYTEAFKWYFMAANQGDSDAQYELGKMFYNGVGVGGNYFKSYRWYLKAAQNGHDDAQYELGKMHYNGVGVGKNHSTSYAWYLKAAQNGHDDAQYHVAMMLREGDGVEKNKKASTKWLNRIFNESYDKELRDKVVSLMIDEVIEEKEQTQ